ncbi:SDR family NAD(P)-dependent oxidoreductase [Candidatus Woesearchaeota archaeon]|nr:SDR family NAD(P)-dependent oxidoreductase [Candidatus Woesearchaeota archaeon]
MELKGKVALVTGASSGIGKAIAEKLCREGVKVALLSEKPDELEKVAEEIRNNGGDAFAAPAGLTKQEEVKAAVDKVLEHYKGVDILVNNAGLGMFKNIEDLTVEEWDLHINVMLRGHFLVTKYLLPQLYEKKAGHIIFLSSLWAKKFCAKCSAYTAAKFGIRGFVQSLREEARPHNVKVTNVMPGTVKSPFFDKAEWTTDLSKALETEDVANLISDLLKYPDRAVVEEVILQAIQPDQNLCQ